MGILTKYRKIGVSVAAISLLLLAACGDSKEESGGEGDLGSAKLVTNWFAQPEHGGNYAALKQGFYEEEGIDMTIEPGGPQISATQIVASGKAQFGYTQAEDLLISRSKGIPLVAIGAIFQKSPQVLIGHKGKLADFNALAGKTVYTASGSGYWEYIKNAYDLEAKEMAYTGSLATFVNDENAVTQGYYTSEVHTLAQEGVDIDYLFIHDSGFETYANVIFTTEDVIKENPELVQAFMDATAKGWEYYRDHSDEINPFLQEKNPDLTMDLLDYGAEVEEELIFGGDAKEHGFGYMSSERWEALQDELLDLGIIKEKEDISKVFTTEFLGK